MKRFLGVVLCAALVMTVSSSVTADADEAPPPPVVTSTAGGFDGPAILLEATSAAPYVLFRLSNATDRGPYAMGSPVAPDADGVFRSTVPWRGLRSESFATAVNCTALAVESCSTSAGPARAAFHTRTVQLANAGQVLDPAVQNARVVIPPVGDQPVRLAVYHYGTLVHSFGEFAAGEHEVTVPAIADADYQFWLARCSLVNPLVCDAPRSNESDVLPQLHVRRKPDARFLFDCNCAAHEDVNPNGDGIRDRVEFLIVPDRAVPLTSGTWRMVDRTGRTVVAPRAMKSGALTGEAPVVLDPRAEGLRLKDGFYRVKFSVAGVVSGTTRQTLLERRLEVWNSRSLLGIRADAPAFYPVLDGYRDTIDLDPSFRMRYLTWMKVVRADGQVVRTFRPPWIRSWNGRSAQGRLAGPGRYRFVYRIDAPGGEQRTFQTPLFNLSHKRLVTKTFRKTVTAKSSLIADRSGRCARGLRAEHTGAIRYLSGWCSGSRPENSATGVHQLSLPRGLPIAIKVGATGHSLRGTHQATLIGLERPSGRRLIWSDFSGRGTWFMHLDVGQFFPKDRKLRWVLETAFGNEFRVRTFTVVYRYRVLQ